MLFIAGIHDAASGGVLSFGPSDYVNTAGNDAAAGGLVNDTQGALNVPSMSSTETTVPTNAAGERGWRRGEARRQGARDQALALASSLVLPEYNASAPVVVAAARGIIIWFNLISGVVGPTTDAKVAALLALTTATLSDPVKLKRGVQPALAAIGGALPANSTLPDFSFEANFTYVALTSNIFVYATPSAAAIAAAGAPATAYDWMPLVAAIASVLALVAAATLWRSWRRRAAAVVQPMSSIEIVEKGPALVEEEEMEMDARVTAHMSSAAASGLNLQARRLGEGEDVLAFGEEKDMSDLVDAKRRRMHVLKAADVDELDTVAVVGGGFAASDLLERSMALAKRESTLAFQRRMNAQNKVRESHYRAIKSATEAKKKEEELAELQGAPLMLRAIKARPAMRPWWSSPVTKTVHLNIGEARVYKAHPDARGTPEALALFKKEHPELC